MQPTLLIAPTARPVTVDEAMFAARQDEPHWRPEVERAIDAAVQLLEHETSRRLMAQTWRYPLPGWPSAQDVLPEHQASTVAITYRSPAGVWETLNNTTFLWGPVPGGINIVPVMGQVWPEYAPDEFGHAVRVDITAGATTPAQVPAAAKHFVLGMVALKVPGQYGDDATKHEQYLLRALDPLRLYK